MAGEMIRRLATSTLNFADDHHLIRHPGLDPGPTPEAGHRDVWRSNSTNMSARPRLLVMLDYPSPANASGVGPVACPREIGGQARVTGLGEAGN
jgi:hypothetical protein